MSAALDSMSRQAVKRQILDQLDEGHKFEVPQQLVDAEFDTIWQRVVHEVEHHGRSFEDEGTTEEAAREQYKKIAERRVRLGLVVAEIGNENKIEVTEEEHQQALIAEVRRFQGQEQQVYDYYRKNPQALAALRAPVFENKVVDFVTELAEKTDKSMTRAELSKLIAAGRGRGSGGAPPLRWGESELRAALRGGLFCFDGRWALRASWVGRCVGLPPPLFPPRKGEGDRYMAIAPRTRGLRLRLPPACGEGLGLGVAAHARRLDRIGGVDGR